LDHRRDPADPERLGRLREHELARPPSLLQRLDRDIEAPFWRCLKESATIFAAE
jgi:hypothetical protein